MTRARDDDNKWDIPVAAPSRRERADAILAEIDDEDLALLLWRVLRYVWEWANTPGRDRDGGRRRDVRNGAREQLILARAGAPELADALEVLVLTPGASAGDGAGIAGACGEVAEWAEASGRSETAVQFGEAAAAVQPREAIHANRAGRVNRRAGNRDRADVWYQRAISLARQREHWGEYIRGHLGLGALWYNAGDHDRARPYFERAASRGRREGFKAEAAEALHDLLLLSAEIGRFAEAEVYARRALQTYPIHHRRLPYLVADFSFLLVSAHQPAAAVPLLESFLAVIPQAAEQVLGTSTLAAAAGAAGDAARYEAAEQRVLTLIERYQEHAAPALVNLGKGAHALGRWAAAAEHTARGINGAVERGDSEVERVGRALLADIEAKRLAPPAVSAAGSKLRELASEMAARLARWKGPAWQRNRKSGPGERAA